GNRVNELRVGFNRIRDDLFPWVTDTTPAAFGFKGIPDVAGVTGLPRIAIGGFSNIGEAAFLPNFKISEVSQAGDTFSFLGVRYDPFPHPDERNAQQAHLLLDRMKLIYVNDSTPPSIPSAFTTTIPAGVSPTTLMRLDTNNVAPRLGFAWRLGDRTVLRGGAN